MSKTLTNETKRGLWRRLLSLLLAVLALTLLLAGTALADDTSATAAPEVLFSLEPASAAAQPSGYFVFSAKAGDAVQESAHLRNLTKDAITVSLAPVDGTSGLYGGVTYALPTDTAKHVGTWISISQATVTLEPEGSAEIPFTVNVPSDASTGVNVGGLTAWIPAKKDDSTTTSTGFSAQVIIQTRRVVAVVVNVPGDDVPVLKINGLTTAARASGEEIGIQIENTGHGMASGTGTIDIPSTGFHKDFTVGDILPGTSLVYPIEWVTDPEQQAYDTTVSIKYNDGKTVDWTGSFTIGETAVSELQNYVTTTTAGPNAASSSGISMTLIIVIIVAAFVWLAIVGVGTLLILHAGRRRRAREQAERQQQTPPSAPGEIQ